MSPPDLPTQRPERALAPRLGPCSLVHVDAVLALAGRVLVPALDVLQSIPVLGFMPGLVLALVGAFPDSNIGLELAAVSVTFTGQAWNMTSSFYYSLRSIPNEMREVAAANRFTRGPKGGIAGQRAVDGALDRARPHALGALREGVRHAGGVGALRQPLRLRREDEDALAPVKSASLACGGEPGSEQLIHVVSPADVTQAGIDHGHAAAPERSDDAKIAEGLPHFPAAISMIRGFFGA